MQVDEQTLNKGAMREKRVQAALQVALRNLAELEGTAGMVVPRPWGSRLRPLLLRRRPRRQRR